MGNRIVGERTLVVKGRTGLVGRLKNNVFWLFSKPKKVRNELTSAEFALNLNGAGSGSKNDREKKRNGNDNGGEDSVNSAVGRAAGGSTAVGRGGGAVAAGSKSEIDYDSIAERLEASLRTLQAGRPLSLLEAVSQDEVGWSWGRGDGGVVVVVVVGEWCGTKKMVHNQQ